MRTFFPIFSMLFGVFLFQPCPTFAQQQEENPATATPPTTERENKDASWRKGGGMERLRKMRENRQMPESGVPGRPSMQRGMQPPPGEGMGMKMHGPGNGVRGAQGDGNNMFPRLHAFLETIPPEEREKMKRQFRENPDQFREVMTERFRKWREDSDHQRDQNHDMNSLRKQYINAKTDAEKQEVLTRIRKSSSDQFDEKMEMNRKKLEFLEQKIGELREEMENRQSHRDEIIEERVKALTRDPNLQW